MFTQKVIEIEKLIAAANNIAIISHFNPDGDAIGSTTALHYFLSSMGKDSTIIIPSKIPSYLDFLIPDDGKLKIYTESKQDIDDYICNSDLLFCLDFNALSRTEFLEEHISKAKAQKVLIDHHPNPQVEIYDLSISDIQVSSTCELLYRVLMSFSHIRNDASNLSLECAQSLYTGMMTDTNNYSNSVYPYTMSMASALLSKGVDKDKIQAAVFGAFSEQRMHLMGYLLCNKMTVLSDLGLAYIMLSKEDKHNFDYAIGDSEGFVNLPFSIKGVQFTALFTQADDYIRVSLRSRGDYSANEVAKKYFNGGGHDKAAGGRSYLPFEQVAQFFEESFKQYAEQIKARNLKY